MPRFSFRFLLPLALALLAPLIRADESLGVVCAAQIRLGPTVWSQVIRVENTDARNAYPREFHALVFELAGILWLYNPADGTRSLSRVRGRLADDKADFGPLLRAIEPGFTRWTPVPATLGASIPTRTELPNGCFIASVGAWRERRDRGDEAAQARLLSFYANRPGHHMGHTVLTYEVAGHAEVIDPERPDRTTTFPHGFGSDALAAAQAFAGDYIVGARWVLLDPTESGARVR